MAQYEHLPIYKKAYDLTLYFEKIVRNFSRYDKYTVGTDLRQLSREVLRLIRRANDADDKTAILLQNRERLEDLKMTVRLCKDMKALWRGLPGRSKRPGSMQCAFHSRMLF
jgi:hypothetical protein